MPRNKTAVSDLGSIDAHGTEFRAHIQFRGNAGEQKNIRGPSRGSQHEAQRDLDQLRKAGSIGTTREEGINLMEVEAKQIKTSAEYQAQIQEALHRMSSKDLPDESDYEDDSVSDHSEPPYLKEHLVDDSSEEAETSQKQ